MEPEYKAPLTAEWIEISRSWCKEFAKGSMALCYNAICDMALRSLDTVSATEAAHAVDLDATPLTDALEVMDAPQRHKALWDLCATLERRLNVANCYELPNPIWMAKFFHDTYERLAPQFGYETRPDTKVFDYESPNGRLMAAVCEEFRKTVTPPTV